ncbi:MAG: hypothetical protein HY219_00590 [Candidatus Staskawiczbacteria bacterium]|nr:hypothetical protein [Candidatus Staskawiczbacteria bacterium]
MSALTKEKPNKKEFVSIPRSEYEEFLQFKKIFPAVEPTKVELRMIKHAEKDFKEGKYIEWRQFKHELANLSKKSSTKRT